MKKNLSTFYKNLFLGNKLLPCLAVSVLLFLLAFFFPWMAEIPLLFFCTLLALVCIDVLLLYRKADGLFSTRNTPEKLSNNDENELRIFVENFYSFPISIGIIDEIPVQFQKRDVWFKTQLKSKQNKTITYLLRPVKRGEYEFGDLKIFVQSPLSLISRRYIFKQSVTLQVYPSFLQMRRFELLAISNRLTEFGIKKIRRLGHSMEFEQIKNYVPGDDFRTINWKASARKGDMMVNSYSNEKAQHVYCVIDKSRSMKMPFNGLSLLDYAINASLVLSNVALLKEDKAGLITISEKTGAVLAADRKPTHIRKIMEILFKEKTRYLETNMEALYSAIRTTLKQRSLVVFFTNYESLPSMERQLPFLKKIAKFHYLLVVFFENTELKSLNEQEAKDVEGIYIKTIAQKFTYEKKLIVKELARHGIQSLLTTPQDLTINAINRYLDLKSRQKI